MEIKAEGAEGPEGLVRPVKERKKHDRFNGMSEEEVARRTLPDHLAENLDIIIVSMIDTHTYLLVARAVVVHGMPSLEKRHL